jgi:uncharacterized protein
MSRFRRWLIKTAHLIHVYVTLFGLALILFFAVTGFMLNHIEWFEMERVHTVTRPLPLDKLPNKKLPEPDSSGEATGDDKLAIVEALRKEFGLPGELTSFSFAGETDDDGNTHKYIKVEFKRAGEITEAKIDRDTGVAAVEYKSQGWMAVTTDLHRGNRGNRTNETKFTGRVWSVVIDGTCVLLVVVCVTGFFLWWSLKGRGQYGALFALGGTAMAFALYYWFVP